MNKSINRKLILDKIVPHYNYYVENKNVISGNKSLKIMWEIGDILSFFIKKYDLPPNNLFRQVYGKSEGNFNISQLSYISAEFQKRCFRIRNIFDLKNEIDVKLPSLVSFTCFREAMPFFDNKKFKMSNKELNSIITLLNSNNKPSVVIKKLEHIKSEKIGIKNSRKQRLHELEPLKKDFIKIYKEIKTLIDQNDFLFVREKLNISNTDLIYFSKFLDVLTNEDYRVPELKNFDKTLDSNFDSLNDLLIKLFAKKNMKQRQRFRRLIPILRIGMLSEMIYSLTDEKIFKKFKK